MIFLEKKRGFRRFRVEKHAETMRGYEGRDEAKESMTNQRCNGKAKSLVMFFLLFPLLLIQEFAGLLMTPGILLRRVYPNAERIALLQNLDTALLRVDESI